MSCGTLPTDPLTRYAAGGIRLALPPWAEQVYKDLGLAVPPPVEVLAVVDTGATHTCVHPRVRASLGLPATGTVDMGTASGAVERCITYPVRVLFADGNFVDLTVAEFPPKQSNMDCLLGCDILQFAVFIYNGPQKQFTICL